MTAVEIYNLLAAGKTVQMEFPSAENAATFRGRLYRIKNAQDSHLIGLGMMEEEDVMSVHFQLKDCMVYQEATIKFQKRQPRKTYEVLVLDDDGNST